MVINTPPRLIYRFTTCSVIGQRRCFGSIRFSVRVGAGRVLIVIPPWGGAALSFGQKLKRARRDMQPPQLNCPYIWKSSGVMGTSECYTPDCRFESCLLILFIEQVLWGSNPTAEITLSKSVQYGFESRVPYRAYFFLYQMGIILLCMSSTISFHLTLGLSLCYNILVQERGRKKDVLRRGFSEGVSEHC